MCGICGIVDLDGGGRLSRNELARADAMLRAMRHRGPDGEARLARGNVVIAANHLAIRSTQPPLVECDVRVLVACNGEIDNHRGLRRSLASRGYALPATDVGVIAPLYLEVGLAFVEKLRGAFALALWDQGCQHLILARDRAGERHLYYAVMGHRVVFASELAALTTALAEPAAPDAEGLAHYLGSGYCPAPLSPLQGIRKVAPGAVVVIAACGTWSRRYWSLPAPDEAALPSLCAFDRVLRDAVARQSDVDADYGVLLSGGVDSALVAALLRKLHPARPLPAYSIRFAEASFDEGEAAQRVAYDFDCTFVPVTVTPEDVPRNLRALIAATGELIADPAWIPVATVAERASRDVRMLFGGEGADELFGGYPTYLGACWAPRYARLPGWVRGATRRLVETWPVSDRKVAVSFLLKRFVQGQSMDVLARHVAWMASITPERLRRLGIEPRDAPHQRDSMGALDAVQRHDFTHALPEAFLAKADRGAMLHGVEIRTPFLDRDVIDFALALPARERVHGLTTKAFLKRHALQYLPRSVVNRRKRGLSVPLATWLRGPLGAWARARLGGADLARAGIDTRASLLLLDEHQQRRADHARAIWTLIVLSEWLEWLRAIRAAAPAVDNGRSQEPVSAIPDAALLHSRPLPAA